MVPQVGYELRKRLASQGIGRMRGSADQINESCAALAGDFIQLQPEYHVRRGRRPAEQRQVFTRDIDRLEERADWRDADTASDQQHRPPSATLGCHRAVRSLRENPRANSNGLDPSTPLAEGFDRYSEAP